MAQNKNCPECGQENNKEARFCGNCGGAFNLQASQKKVKVIKSISEKRAGKKPQSASSFFGYPILIIVGGLIILFLYMDYNKKEVPNRDNSFIKPTSQDFTLERNVMLVAAKFTCSCGSCGEEALETCTCGTAEQERNFIRRELQSGNSVSQAVFAVNARYGHLKPEYVDKIEGGGLNLDFSTQNQNDIFSQISGSSSNSNDKIATIQDREKIFSHFECPCGQCSIPELRDCSCQHPNGATEVKLFVASKIEGEQYKISELIDIVEKEYGHKIR